MQLLLAHGANPDNGGWDYDWGLEYTVMERLTLSNHHSSFLDEMKILINAGANPPKALQMATYLSNFDVAHLIMNHVTGPRIEWSPPLGLIVERPNERGKLWRRDKIDSIAIPVLDATGQPVQSPYLITDEKIAAYPQRFYFLR